jgi:hypothetical protein
MDFSVPCKGDFDMLFVHGKPQVEELELTIVPVEHIPA